MVIRLILPHLSFLLLLMSLALDSLRAYFYCCDFWHTFIRELMMEYILSLLVLVMLARASLIFLRLYRQFEQIFIYLNAWYVKIKLYMLIKYLELSYRTAEFLLNENWCNQFVIFAFNYCLVKSGTMFLFKVPQALCLFQLSRQPCIRAQDNEALIIRAIRTGANGSYKSSYVSYFTVLDALKSGRSSSN